MLFTNLYPLSKIHSRGGDFVIFTVTLNPAVDKTVYIPGFAVDHVNRVSDGTMDPGGKGINVSKSVQALGGDTMCLGILGGATGQYIADTLDRMGIKHDMVLSERPTRTNIKIVDLQNKTNTDINEPGAAVEQRYLDAVWEKLSAAVQEGDVVVFAGKNPPGTPDDLLARWTKALVQKNVRVCLDTVAEPMKLALREKPAIIKPNKEELEQLLDRRLETQTDLLHAGRELNKMGVGLVAISLGGDGALFVTENSAVRAHVPAVRVVSTVGAGDSMMAALAYYMQQGCSLEELGRRAAAVATATVQIDGSKPAQIAQITPLLEQIRTEIL